MAMKTATRMSTLNPNAPLFIPASYHAAEDFSPEWWHLVQTCPAFRDFWLRERFDDCMVDAASLLDANDEFEAIDDLLDMQDVHMDGLKEFEVECALDNVIGDNYEKDILYALDDLNLNELQAQRIWREPLKHHDKISSKSPRKQLRGGNQNRIHQPRA